jgi:hypothetical protein
MPPAAMAKQRSERLGAKPHQANYSTPNDHNKSMTHDIYIYIHICICHLYIQFLQKCYIMYASLLPCKASATTSSTLRVPPPAWLVPELGGYAPNYYLMTIRVVSVGSLARGLSTNNYSTWLLRFTWRRAWGLNATRVPR